MTPEQIKEINNSYPELTITEICKKFDITLHYANKYVTKPRTTSAGRKRLAIKPDQNKFIRDNRLTKSIRTMATELNIGINRVSNFMEVEGLKLTRKEQTELIAFNKPKSKQPTLVKLDDYKRPEHHAEPWNVGLNTFTLLPNSTYPKSKNTTYDYEILK